MSMWSWLTRSRLQIEKRAADTSLLSHLVTSKQGDHLPLYPLAIASKAPVCTSIGSDRVTDIRIGLALSLLVL